ncbi:MAG: flagellar export protein FliJ [Fibrobacter sp.]|nr:flagellar export protein FliJ [Fibrobacter sp.]
MKKFNFTLQSLLDIRLRKEDEIKLMLAKKINQIQQSFAIQNEIHDKLRDLQETEKKRRKETENVSLLKASVAYRFKLKADLIEIVRKIDTLKNEADNIRAKLTEATKQRRAIEILKENKFSEWKKEQNDLEQKFIDDISQQSFIRKTRQL